MTKHPLCDHGGFTINYEQRLYPLLNVNKKLYQSSQLVECATTLCDSLSGSVASKRQGRINFPQLATMRSLRFLQDSGFIESLSLQTPLNCAVAKFEECYLLQDIVTASYYLNFSEFFRYLTEIVDRSNLILDSDGSNFVTFADKLNDYLALQIPRDFQNVGTASPLIILIYNVVGHRVHKKVRFELKKCMDDYTKLRALFSYTHILQNTSKKLTYSIPYFRCFSEVIKDYSSILQSELEWKDLKKLKPSKFYELIDLMRLGIYVQIINESTESVQYFEGSLKQILFPQEQMPETQSLEGLRCISFMNSEINKLFAAKIIFSDGLGNRAPSTYFEVILDHFFEDYEKKISNYTDKFLEKFVQKIETILKQQRKADFKLNDSCFDGNGSKVALLICEDFRSFKHQLQSLPKATKIFLLTRAVIEFMRMYILHIHKFKYSSLGTLVLIKDIYSYSEVVHDESKLSDFLWQTLLSIANLILVKPENIRGLLTDGNLAFFDTHLLEEFTFLKEDNNRVDTHPVSSLFFIA